MGSTTVTVKRIGNRLMVELPAEVADQLGVVEGDGIEFCVGDALIVVDNAPNNLPTKRPDWDTFFGQPPASADFMAERDGVISD